MGAGPRDTAAPARRGAAGWSMSHAAAGGPGLRRAAAGAGAPREGHAHYVRGGARPRVRCAADACGAGRAA